MKEISHVINYVMPNDIESYIHRIGRTGRKNQKGGYHEGMSVTYIDPPGTKVLQDLVRIMTDAGYPPSEDVRFLAQGARFGGGARYSSGRGGRPGGSNSIPLGGGGGPRRY